MDDDAFHLIDRGGVLLQIIQIVNTQSHHHLLGLPTLDTVSGGEDDGRVAVEEDPATPVPGPVRPEESHLPGYLLRPSHDPSHCP